MLYHVLRPTDSFPLSDTVCIPQTRRIRQHEAYAIYIKRLRQHIPCCADWKRVLKHVFPFKYRVTFSKTKDLGKFLFILIFAFSSSSFADDFGSAVAGRVENGTEFFYATLNEAFDSAGGISIDAPDEIILLRDCILSSPIIVAEGKHIRLVSGDGSRTIRRGSSLLEYPLFWLNGNHASLSLGKADMEGSLVIDGGYLNSTPIKALAPLAAVSGQHSKLIMYDKVTLQNNYNVSGTDGTHPYRNGAGVYIRTFEGSIENQAEFIMKGGVIKGNINNTQNPVSCGGGVYISGFALFKMEGGVIMDNTAYRAGGGFHTGSRGSFNKTGGIIYGKDAPKGYRNTVVFGVGSPKYYGHALSAALTDKPMSMFRNNTVWETDFLSYKGSAVANGVFGEDEKWDNPVAESRRYLIVIAVLAVSIFAVFFIELRKTRRGKAETAKPGIEADRTVNAYDDLLSPREREVFAMLLTDVSIKEIAYTLKLTYSGVNFHIKNIYGKLGIQSRTELLVKYPKSR